VNNAQAGTTYLLTLTTNPTYFLTVREGTPGGPVIATGTGSVLATPTSTGSIYVHVNTDEACGTLNSCNTLTVAYSSGTEPPVSLPLADWAIYLGVFLITLMVFVRGIMPGRV
jgi:hypothetical protein